MYKVRKRPLCCAEVRGCAPIAPPFRASLFSFGQCVARIFPPHDEKLVRLTVMLCARIAIAASSAWLHTSNTHKHIHTRYEIRIHSNHASAHTNKLYSILAYIYVVRRLFKMRATCAACCIVAHDDCDDDDDNMSKRYHGARPPR